MFESLNRIDWDLLHEQKLVLLAMREPYQDGSTERDALSGIVHLLDALQDEAVEKGVWAFSDEEPSQEGEVHNVEP